MKGYSWSSINKPGLCVIMIFLFLGCKKDESIQIPVVVTAEIIGITSVSASSGGNLISDGGSAITARGVCWDEIASEPSVKSNKTVDGTGIGIFTSELTGLKGGTRYFVRAYASNSKGTGYGDIVLFATPAVVPILETKISDIWQTSISSVGTIITENGSAISACGVCWGTNKSPTIDKNKSTIDTLKAGSFRSSITGLSAGTYYYVRAYATNNSGTGYGNEFYCATPVESVPSVVTGGTSSFTGATLTIKSLILLDGGLPILARGVCWSTSEKPTLADEFTTDGTGIGRYYSTMTNLSNRVTYYYRAYATNSIGTSYGLDGVTVYDTFPDLTEFNSSSTYESMSDIDGNSYKTIKIGTQVWMAENLKTSKYNDGTIIPNVEYYEDWQNLNTPGYCWFNNNLSDGALYNWFVINTKKLAPTGWHIPTDAEWAELNAYMGGDNIAGGKLKETGTFHWVNPNTGATNESGFSALPKGYRNSAGSYVSFGLMGSWYSSTGIDANNAWIRRIDHGSSVLTRISSNAREGRSVRCIKD